MLKRSVICFSLMVFLSAANVARASAEPTLPAAPAHPAQTETVALEPMVIKEAPLPACSSVSEATQLLNQIDRAKASVAPIRDAVGYVQAPQGLAVKLFNDHVAKLPAWLNYVADPVGSLKKRAIDTARESVGASLREQLTGGERGAEECSIGSLKTSSPAD